MSALALADLSWRARRDPDGGPPLVRIRFLGDRGRRGAVPIVTSIGAYIASLTGKPHRLYDVDEPVRIAGDRRLGRALASVWLEGYRWRTPSFEEAVPHLAPALAAAGIVTPSQLRLRLFDLVNQCYAGFVPSAGRSEVLAQLAATLGIEPEAAGGLEEALALDAEERAILTLAGSPAEPVAILAAYNRAVLAALLRHSTKAVFSLRAPDGGLLRRLYAICRRLGVYCDLEKADAGGEGFRLTLAGPDAVAGPPAAAGPRLAAVALRLLAQLGPADTGQADLILHERPYRLPLDAALLQAPGLSAPVPESEDSQDANDAGAEAARYDSEVEARLARDFAVLRRQERAAGWRLLREPAPLIAGRRVLIPDFALVRGDLRIFVEVAGFWTPGYLARKRQALEQLDPETPLILAVAQHAVAPLTGLPFPLLPYRQRVPLDQLLTLAEERFGDFAARTAAAVGRLQQACAASASGWIDESELAALLGCHSSGEVLRAITAEPPPSGWKHIPGAGLAAAALCDPLDAALDAAWADLGADARLTLPELRTRLPCLALPDGDPALLALLEHSCACTVVRDSLFEVTLQPPGRSTPSLPLPRPRRRRSVAQA